MSLFQHSVLNKYLKEANQEEIKAAYEKLLAYFHNPVIQQNIRESKEEQFQEGFLRELFVKVLGYTINPDPDFNLSTEFKNERGAKKADGAILVNGEAIGVIELKSTKTKDLETIRLQAFDYKANQQKCVYVVTSNFEKIRFYINNAVEFEEFDLFKLSYEDFQLLWLCLSKENLLKGIPLAIKEASILKEENVTKQIYIDYSLFKRELYSDLIHHNLGLEIFSGIEEKEIKLQLFKKSQKLLDRFLFIFFGEDRGLLPPNSISQILTQWEQLKELDEYKPLYDRYKKYFNYLNTGWKGKQYEIFAYNGGLFAPDEILDSIIISDELLQKHTKVLTAYDFETDVDVNILGHIFENSLNEIEEITAQISSADISGKVKNTTGGLTSNAGGLTPLNKRKKDGVFYTPKYITKYIVENTVGKLCIEKKTKLGIEEGEYLKSRKGRTKKKLLELSEKLDTYRNWLLTLTICDPACGSGAFLNQALDFLINEHHYIDELKAKLLDVPIIFTEVENSILENNIYGVDINEESVEIAKLSLWLRTAQKGRKLTTLSNNIKCGNSLIDDLEVAGNKAFHWQTEFPEVFREKKKQAWHITTATHNSRTSKRMWNLNIEPGEAVWLDTEQEVLVTQAIADIVEKDKLNILAYNICGDHMHMLLVCEEAEINDIVAKIKGRSSYHLNKSYRDGHDPSEMGNENRGVHPHEEYRGVNPSGQDHEISGVNPTGQGVNPPEKVHRYSDGTIKHTWTRKFNTGFISSEKQLENTIAYIQNNRKKHQLPNNKELEQLIPKILCTQGQAHQTEYAGGFDVVIGNPPYVNFSNLPEFQRNYFKQNSQICKNKTDLYAFFIEKSTLIIKPNGRLSFIMPHTWISTTSFTPLRELIYKNYQIKNLVELEHGVFHDAIVKTIIIVCEKGSTFNGVPIFNKKFQFLLKIPKEVILNDEEMIINFDWTPQKQLVENKLFESSVRLDSLLKFTRGIKTSNDKRFLHFKCKNEEYKKVIRGRNIKAFRIDYEGEYVWYRPDLMKEKVGCLPHSKELFEVEEKLITQRVNSSGELLATYDNKQFYCLDTTNVSVINKKLEIDLKYILVILNSRLINWWFNDKFKMPTISGYELHQIPIKINKDIESAMINYATLKLEQSPSLKRKLVNLLQFLQSQFQIETFSKKLQNWHTLEFADFIKELNKAIKKVGGEKLSKMDEMEWMEVFETKKAEAQTLKAEIEKTDKAIDQMVYELYGLTEEEIRIVEGS